MVIELLVRCLNRHLDACTCKNLEVVPRGQATFWLEAHKQGLQMCAPVWRLEINTPEFRRAYAKTLENNLNREFSHTFIVRSE